MIIPTDVIIGVIKKWSQKNDQGPSFLELQSALAEAMRTPVDGVDLGDALDDLKSVGQIIEDLSGHYNVRKGI